MKHKQQPSYGQDGITRPWEPISEEMQKGLELAAYICRMFGEGEIWAEGILCKGEQIRAMWWMEYERKNGSLDDGSNDSNLKDQK
jgi:hypothetical protein